MAMEMWVLSDKRLGSIAEWQAAIDAAGFPLSLSGETAFEDLRGFLPAKLRGRQTGVEVSHSPAGEFMRDFSDVDFGREWKYVLAFRWRGDFDELRTAWIAGAAYAQATNGIVFDDQEAKVRNATEAMKVARLEFEAPNPDLNAPAQETSNAEQPPVVITVRVFK